MTARTTVVSHAAALLLGLVVAGGVGLWAVGQEQDRTAEQRVLTEETRREAKAHAALARSSLGRAMKAEALLKERDLLLKELKRQLDEQRKADKKGPQ